MRGNSFPRRQHILSIAARLWRSEDAPARRSVAGLAPLLAREIFAVVRRVNAEGVAILLVEQNLPGALRLAARGYVLETGRVVASGASADLAVDPRIRSAYLGLDRPRPAATS